MISGLKFNMFAIAFIASNLSAFSQDTKSPSTPEKTKDIIIHQKGDKDEKMTIIVDGDKVTINGKPVEEFNNKNVTVLRRNNSAMNAAPRARSYSSSSDNFRMFDSEGASSWNSNKAVLGVTTSKTEEGAQVTDITKESGAAKAGLQKNDVITKVANSKIKTPEDLIEAIAKFKPNDKIDIVYLREGKENKTNATLTENKTRAYSFNFSPDLNFNVPRPNVSGFTFNRRPRIGLQIQDVEEGKGVMIKDVDEDSPAAKAEMKEGDIITQINGKEIAGVEEVREEIKDVKEGDTIKLSYKRGGKIQTSELKIPKRLRTADL